MKFYKYQGTGNDFIMIDNRSGDVELSKDQIAFLCHRRFGIGADGLIFLTMAEGYDFRMIYHNADGAEGSMCGNGGRCTVQFANDLGVFENKTNFIAIDGPHEAEVLSNGNISLKMGDVSEFESGDNYHFCNTGSPHVVSLQENVKGINVNELGKKIRYSDFWMGRGGTNVNFMEFENSSSLIVRTYERGVEDETYSCGTGVTACALIANKIKNSVSPIQVKTLGGDLEVSFELLEDKSYHNIRLIGPAKLVYEGIFNI